MEPFQVRFKRIPEQDPSKITVFLLVGLLLLWSTFSRAEGTLYKGIDVRGDDRFKKQTIDALQLIEKRASNAFYIIKRCVGRIEQGSRSGMRAAMTPPTYVVNDRTAFYSLTWYASTIAHDSYHCMVYQKAKKAHGEPVPAGAWTGKLAEQDALAHQLRTLHAIGADDHEINHVVSQDGSHFDINGDGKYTREDWEQRDW